jgi:hypothetical protein
MMKKSEAHAKVNKLRKQGKRARMHHTKTGWKVYLDGKRSKGKTQHSKKGFRGKKITAKSVRKAANKAITHCSTGDGKVNKACVKHTLEQYL